MPTPEEVKKQALIEKRIRLENELQEAREKVQQLLQQVQEIDDELNPPWYKSL